MSKFVILRTEGPSPAVVSGNVGVQCLVQNQDDLSTQWVHAEVDEGDLAVSTAVADAVCALGFDLADYTCPI